MGSKTKSRIDVHIRWTIRRDMPEVLKIESACFDSPWTEEDFISTLRQRNCIGMIAEYRDETVGFMVYELNPRTLHLLNFAVDPLFWRTGVGTAMVGKLISKLSPDRRTSITLHVRESNLAAQLFFKSQGFIAVEVCRGFYRDSEEDAYLMEYRL